MCCLPSGEAMGDKGPFGARTCSCTCVHVHAHGLGEGGFTNEITNKNAASEIAACVAACSYNFTVALCSHPAFKQLCTKGLFCHYAIYPVVYSVPN